MAVAASYIGLQDVASSAAPTALEVQNAIASAPATVRELLYSGSTSTATLSANTNNLAPAGLATARTVILDATNDWTLTSMTGTDDERQILLVNKSAFIITLEHESASGTAANRFHCLDAVSKELYPGGSIDCRYDAAISRWRPIDASHIVP